MKDLLIKVQDSEGLIKNKNGYGISYDVSDDHSKPIIETIWFDTKKERDLVFTEIEKEQRDKFDECYDCKDEYETPLVKKGNKTLCEDCINWGKTKEEFANSPFALIVK